MYCNDTISSFFLISSVSVNSDTNCYEETLSLSPLNFKKEYKKCLKGTHFSSQILPYYQRYHLLEGKCFSSLDDL